MSTEILFENAWIFPTYSFLGWCLEVIYCSVNTGKFVNRGFLNGAACPIYGIGASILILLLTSVQDNLFLLYFGSVILGSSLELVGGFMLKKLFNMSWWDYCDEPLNIGGYICLKFSLGWGIVGVILMNVIHPLVLRTVSMISTTHLIAFMIVFYIFFIIDLIITVLAVLEFSRDIKEIDRLSELLHKGSDKMAEGIGNTALQATSKIKELELSEKTKEITERIQSVVEDNYERLENSERLNRLLNKRSAIRMRFLGAFPRIKDIRTNNAINEIKKHIKNSIIKTRNDEEEI